MLSQAGKRAVMSRALGVRLSSSFKPSFFEANNFDGFAEQKEAEEQHAEKAANTWRSLSFFVAAPITIAIGFYALSAEAEHKTHKRPEFIPFDHMRRRVKPFPWGDGQHTFFHNPVTNALSDGYELPDPNNPDCKQIQDDPPRWN